ncbi:MAG: hypothetical protein U9P90_02110 [Patescibacteria group bacterium]|nr:hypothetical protein [Patescibacteria group bacterium]
MFKIKTIECCGKIQQAKFLQIPIPEDILFFRNDFLSFYVAYIDNCINPKCQGKAIKFGVTYEKEIIEYKTKIKYLNLYKRIGKPIDCIEIDSFSKNSADRRFYLLYNEYGEIKRCYSNLSTLKLGRIPDNYEEMRRFKELRRYEY